MSAMGPYCKVYGGKRLAPMLNLAVGSMYRVCRPTVPGKVCLHPGLIVVELKKNAEPEAQCCWVLN